jgi:hypothetical protein
VNIFWIEALESGKRTIALDSIEKLNGRGSLSFLDVPIFRVLTKVESNKICQTKEDQIISQMQSNNLVSSQDSSSYAS